MTWVDSLRPLFDGGNDATRNAHIGRQTGVNPHLIHDRVLSEAPEKGLGGALKDSEARIAKDRAEIHLIVEALFKRCGKAVGMTDPEEVW